MEGRSPNPVALLFDSLTHPDADLGCECPSLLEWERHDDKHVPHVVLGKRLPGGAWQVRVEFNLFNSYRFLSKCEGKIIST